MKKKNLKCVFAMVLSLALLCTACGEQEKTVNQGTVEVSGVNEFPIVKEPITLSVFAAKSGSVADITTNEFTKWYEEKTGIKIEWNLATGDVRQAINLQIASDEFADIFLGFSFARSEQAAYYDQGIFIDMTDLVEEHTYYIKEMFKNEPDAEKMVRHTENKILGLPKIARNVLTETPYKMWVYKPWLDKLGAELPQTTDEFYELLKRFKTEDPNGNGKADEIPLAGRNSRGNHSGIDMYIMNSFLTWGTYGFTIDENGDAVFAPIQDEAREGIRYLRKLYKEGLIHSDSFVMDRTRVTALGENEIPILGCAPGMETPSFTVGGAPSGRMNDYIALPPLEGPNGFRQTLVSAGDPGCTSFSITSSCKDPVAAIKWADWLYSEEAYLRSSAPAGFRLAKEGEIGFDGKSAKFAIDPVDSLNNGAIQNAKWGEVGLCYWPSANSIAVQDNTSDALRKKNAYKGYELYKPYGKSGAVIVDFPVPSDVAEEYLEFRSNIKAEIDAGFVEFIIGERDIEKDWDEYVQNFYRLGLERYTEIVQDYLDSVK